MGTIKYILRRVILTVAVFLAASVSVQRPARAQAVTIDPSHIAISVFNGTREIAQLLQQLGISMEDIEFMRDVMSTVEGITGLLQDVGVMNSMYQSLMAQLNTAKAYGVMLTQMQQAGYSPGMISGMASTLEASVNMVKMMIEQAKKILTDTGLSKAEKMDKAEEYARNIGSASDEIRSRVEMQIAAAEHMRGLNQFYNLVDGQLPDYNLTDLTLPSRPAVDNREYGAGDGFDPSVQNEAKGAGRRSLTLIEFLLGTLLALSLIGITVKYMRGDMHSEAGFARIFVVLVAGVVFLTVLRVVLKIAV